MHFRIESAHSVERLNNIVNDVLNSLTNNLMAKSKPIWILDYQPAQPNTFSATAQHMPNVKVNWILSISKCYMPAWRTRTLHKCSQWICQLSNQLRMSIPWKQSNRPIKLWMIWFEWLLSCRFSEWFFNNLNISFASKLVTNRIIIKMSMFYSCASPAMMSIQLEWEWKVASERKKLYKILRNGRQCESNNAFT